MHSASGAKYLEQRLLAQDAHVLTSDLPGVFFLAGTLLLVLIVCAYLRICIAHIFLYIYIFKFVSVCMYRCLWSLYHTSAYVYIYMYIYIYIYVYMHVCDVVYECVFVYMCICVNACGFPHEARLVLDAGIGLRPQAP